ncbi:MAG: hypothetical protein M0036_09840 [Desulfobacteraceae bacterium]|nr:hypothetical protein [Desulfobacteraceae bacterium]
MEEALAGAGAKVKKTGTYKSDPAILNSARLFEFFRHLIDPFPLKAEKTFLPSLSHQYKTAANEEINLRKPPSNKTLRQ